MTGVEVPALDGREPLGFLASLGMLRLLDVELGGAVQLCFDNTTARARLHSELPTIDAVAERLEQVFARLGDRAVPGMPADFPPPGAAPDRLRVPPEELSDLVVGWEQTADPTTVRSWLRALVTDVGTEDDGRVSITPLAAPSGKQSFSTMFAKTRDAVAGRPAALREALTGWRRVPGYTGEYLDHRVLVSRADSPTGDKGEERGVPGATWLALMAFPLFIVTGRRAAIGWQLLGRRPTMRWPLWEPPVGLDVVRALLSHPALALDSGPTLRSASVPALRRLGVFAVPTAHRRRVEGRKSAGVLTPGPVLVV